MQTFEKALYKVAQKRDEATHSYMLRLQAAFHDLGESVNVKDMHAFVLLRQSSLSNEDKKKVLAMTGGQMDQSKIEQAMRTLSTRVLLGTVEVKRKVYPTTVEEEDALTAEALDLMAQQGDEDAMLAQQFEKDLEDLMQNVPDLQNALVSYQEARQRISERRRHRGFWPPKSRGKGYGARGFRKGGPKGGKDKLLARISRTHCKVCGALDHWKAECPQRRDREQPREQTNVVNDVGGAHEELPQVIIEEMDEAGVVNQSEVCFHAQESVGTRKHPLLSASVRQQAVRVGPIICPSTGIIHIKGVMGIRTRC